MIPDETIEQAVRHLLTATPQGSKVILFGSHIRGDGDARSDLDLLIVEPQVADRFAEMMRLREILDPLKIPVDLLVTTAERFDYWRDTPNTIYYWAAKEGKVYESLP